MMKIKALKDILPNFEWQRPDRHNNALPPQRPVPAQQLGNANSLDFLLLVQNWEHIVGEKMALVSRPVKNIAKEITVATAHPAFSHHLGLLQEDILKKIHQLYPQFGQLRKIRFIDRDKKYFQQKEAWDQLVDRKKEKDRQVQQTLHPHSPEMRKLKSEAKKIWEQDTTEENLPKNSHEEEKIQQQLAALFENIYIQFKHSNEHHHEETSET